MLTAPFSSKNAIQSGSLKIAFQRSSRNFGTSILFGPPGIGDAVPAGNKSIGPPDEHSTNGGQPSSTQLQCQPPSFGVSPVQPDVWWPQLQNSPSGSTKFTG